jgi:hypothetical protein
MVARLKAGRSVVRIPAEERGLSTKRSRRALGAHPSSSLMGIGVISLGQSDGGVKVTTYLIPLTMLLTMCGTVLLSQYAVMVCAGKLRIYV